MANFSSFFSNKKRKPYLFSSKAEKEAINAKAQRSRRIRSIRIQLLKAKGYSLEEVFLGNVIKANIGGIVVCLAMLSAFIPSTWVGDCRTNINAATPIFEAIRSIYSFCFGLLFALYPYISGFFIEYKIRYWAVKGSIKKRLKWQDYRYLFLEQPAALFLFAYLGLMGFAVGLLYPLILVSYYGIYSWNGMQEWQMAATVACAKAQHIEPPVGWFNPWMQLTPRNPEPLPPPPF